MQFGRGLLDLSTDALKRLLGHLHRGELVCPVDAQKIAGVGFQYKSAELMSALRDLDEAGVRAVLVCVLAERNHQLAEQE
jgi:hypothetical protein